LKTSNKSAINFVVLCKLKPINTMKKISLFIAILLISGTSYGQYFLNHNAINSHKDHYLQNHHKNAGNTSKVQTLTNVKQLDSLVVNIYNGSTAIRYAKESFIYDTQGNVTTNISDDFDSNSKLKQTYIYDANNRVIEYQLLEWDYTNNQWNKKTKKVTNYASNSYSTEYSVWDNSLNQWSKEQKSEWFFNQDGLDTLGRIYSWNNQWDLDSRIHISYNSNNDIILELSEHKYAGNWINNRKDEYTYDANNNLINEIHYQWDAQSNSYIYSSKSIYGYNNQNKKVYYVEGDYNPNTSSWYFYDSTYQYFASNGDMDSTMDFTNPTPNSSWQMDLKTKMTYDNNYTFSNLVLPMTLFTEDDLELFNHMLTQINGYSYDNGQWPKDFVYNVYYSDFEGTGINLSTTRNKISISPNPANDYFRVSLDNMQMIDMHIYDASGRLLKSQKLNSSTNINIQDLERGIYFIQFIDENQNVQTHKLIKE